MANNIGPSEGFLSRAFGAKKKRTTDINLPNQSGKVDPRITKMRARGSKMDEVKKGYSIFKGLSAKSK